MRDIFKSYSTHLQDGQTSSHLAINILLAINFLKNIIHCPERYTHAAFTKQKKGRCSSPKDYTVNVQLTDS